MNPNGCFSALTSLIIGIGMIPFNGSQQSSQQIYLGFISAFRSFRKSVCKLLHYQATDLEHANQRRNEAPRRRFGRQSEVETFWPILVRTAVGHGARRLFARRHGMGLSPS